MPRRKNLADDAAELGRVIAGMERAGYKELLDEVRAMARAENKTLSDKLAEIIRIGMSYDKYKNLTLADAMLVMDFIERAFNNFLYPVMYTTGQFSLESSIQQIKTVAEAIGYVPKEYAEKYAEERARQVAEALREEYEKARGGEQKGVISKAIDTIAQTIAQRLGEEVVARLIESGKLDEFLDMMGEMALQQAGRLLAGGGSEGEKGG